MNADVISDEKFAKHDLLACKTLDEDAVEPLLGHSPDEFLENASQLLGGGIRVQFFESCRNMLDINEVDEW